MNPKQITQNGKTDKIEKDFSRLLERYNRSKQVIDQLYQSGGKNDTTIRSEKPFREDREIEQVSRDKYTKVRNLNKELKLTLKEYIDRTRDLEAALVGKDELIGKYEKELRDQQDNLYNQLQEQKEQILKEDQQARVIDDFKQQIQAAKQKLVKKKAKIQVLKEAQRTTEAKFEDQKQAFDKELDRVQKLCEDFSNEIKDTERKYIDVNEENEQIKQLINQKEEDRRYMELMIQEEREKINKLQQKIQDGQDEKKVLQITLENQTKKLSDLEEQLKLADGRYQVLQGKFDQEKQGIKCDLQETLAKRKQKTKQLQSQIQSLEGKLQEKFKEEVITGKLIQDLKGDLLKLQQQLDDQRGKTDSALNEAQFRVQEVNQLKNDIEKFRQTLQLQDEKLTKYDVQYQIDQKEKQKLLHEIELLEQDNRRVQHLVYDQDREIDYIRQQQEQVCDLLNQDILHVEKKVDSLVSELHTARDEINDWKRQCTDLKRQLQQYEEQSNQFKAKYLKSKQNTKNLENEQRFLEEKIKLLENEKLLGEREALKNTAVQQKQVQQSKIKVLDEIQNMIKQHKLRD